MSTSKLKSIIYIITLFSIISCTSHRSTNIKKQLEIFNEEQQDTKTTDLIYAVEAYNDHAYRVPNKNKHNKTRVASNNKTCKSLISTKQLDSFFHKLQDIPIKKIKNRMDKFKSKLQTYTWIAEWNKGIKKFKKTSLVLEQTSLQIVKNIMEVSDKSSEKGKKWDSKDIIQQFNVNIKKLVNKKNTESIREITLQSIQEIKQALLVTSRICKKQVNKDRLLKLHKVLSLFEESLST